MSTALRGEVHDSTGTSRVSRRDSHRGRRRRRWAITAGVSVLLVVALLVVLRIAPLYVREPAPIAGLKPVLVLDGPGRGELPMLDRPMGAAFGPDGRIYAVDTGNNRVVVFRPSGRFLREFGSMGIAKPLPGYKQTWEEGLMNFPLGADVGPDGSLYVADFRNDQIQVFDERGAFLRRFPDPSDVVGRGASGQDGTGLAVTDVAVAGGLVFATDTYQVIVFTTDGEFVRQFGRPGTGPGEFDHLTGITVDARGRVLVADSNNDRVQVMSAQGEHILTIGGTPPDSSGGPSGEFKPYAFGLPRDVVVMSDGLIAVLDAFDFSVVLFDPSGELVGRYGSRGDAPGQLSYPESIASDGTRLLVSDKENNRLQVLEVVR